MSSSDQAPQPQLSRQARRFGRSAGWFLTLAAALELPGILLFVLGHSWVAAIGIALTGLGAPILLIGAGLIGSAAVSGWASRRRPFA